MSTPHNHAEKGDIAKVVLMPGDPLRAKFIAENYLENARCVNTVRNCLGYTGTYKGHEISVFASGMGMPSIGIYSYELYKFYDVDTIIRIGSTGSYTADIGLYEVILGDSAWSKSTYAKEMSGDESEFQYPSEELNEEILAAAKKLGYPVVLGRIHSSDNFYYAEGHHGGGVEHGCVCVEMESFALFHNAQVLGKRAACLLTVSDNLVTAVETTAEERQNSFTRMMEIALEIAK
ncbi:MAG: purine-nucleoside phosphorylase [Erysipelotrichales bacterium]|nr:purine-nucleoside phosphorylase [Erysipelotrichales bacterium]